MIILAETVLLLTRKTKEYDVTLMPISHEKDSINSFQLKEDLVSLDKFVRNAQAFLTSKGIKNEGIENLSKDSISSLVYLAKNTNRYSEKLVSLENNLQIVPLGMPTNEGRISSNFGNRVNPIPSKPKPKVATKTATKTKENTIDSVVKKVAPKQEAVEPKKEIIINTQAARDSIAQLRKARQEEIKRQEEKAKVVATNPKSNRKDDDEDAELMQFHKGIDIAIPFGSPIKCTAAGTVVFAGIKSGYGTCVIISHGNGLATLYAHLSKTLVKANDKVKVGEEIAKSGNSGRSTGPHLHYEVHKNGTPVNPKLFLGW